MNHEEAHALRRIAAILGAVSTPAERRNIALRIEDRISGRDSDPLAFALRHAAALFHPGDVAKTQDIRQRINAAFAAEELVTAIPKEHHHIMLSDLAAWPDRPPMAADSPLRYWVPDAPAQPQAATPAPVAKETPAERRARWLDMFEVEEKREKRGALQRLANSEGVDRSNMGKDIAKARAERDTQSRAGGWTLQLVQDGKRTH